MKFSLYLAVFVLLCHFALVVPQGSDSAIVFPGRTNADRDETVERDSNQPTVTQQDAAEDEVPSDDTEINNDDTENDNDNTENNNEAVNNNDTDTESNNNDNNGQDENFDDSMGKDETDETDDGVDEDNDNLGENEKQDEEETRTENPDDEIEVITNIGERQKDVDGLDEDEVEITTDTCLEIGNALPFIDPETGRMECFDLATRGPCREGEWFVLNLDLDEHGEPQGICAERKCQEKKVFFKGRCRPEGFLGVCKPGQELLNNPFGEGECQCIEGSLPFQIDETAPQLCYHEYLQGPCDDGEHLLDVSSDPELSEDNPLGSACVPHDCPGTQTRYKDGECHEDPECGLAEPLETSEETGKLACKDLALRQLLTLERQCPEGQTLNNNGECKKVIRLGGNERPRRKLATKNLGLKSFIKKRFEG